MHVPVTPTTENQPENVYARLRNRPPEPSAAVAWDEGYVAGFAAGRAAATPDPPTGHPVKYKHGSPVISDDPAAVSPDERLREAVEMYADPESYAAVGFLIDSPAGEFADDFEPFDHNFQPCAEDHPYRRDRPGKRARAALAAADREAPDEETKR